MSNQNARWFLAGFVLMVWATAVLADVFSDGYTVDAGLHIGCGTLLGILIGSGLLGNGNRGGE